MSVDTTFRCSLIASIIGRAVERAKRLRRANMLLGIRLGRVRNAIARVLSLLSGGVVPSRLLLGELDNREPGLALRSRVLEEQVDFFETARTSFRIEKIDRRDDGEVDDGVGGICLVLDIGEHDWACDDDAEVGKRVHGSRLCVLLV